MTWKGREGNRHERGYDYAWTKLRNLYIRANPFCEARLEGCKGVARIVHHVIPVHVRPDLRLERSNLQSVCDVCHKQLHGERVRGLVVSVLTPPLVSPTDYLSKHARKNDIVFDADALYSQFNLDSGHASHNYFVQDMRNSMIQRVRSGLITRTMWHVTNTITEAYLGDQYVCPVVDAKLAAACIDEQEPARRAKLLDKQAIWFVRYAKHIGTSGTPPDSQKTADLRTIRGDPVFSPSGSDDVQSKTFRLLERLRNRPQRWKTYSQGSG